jgi:hypothetical protein
MSLPRRRSEPGPLLDYIQALQKTPDGAKIVKALILDLRTALDTPQGKRLLDLLEVSTLCRNLPVTSDVRALEANNAQSFIALDLRRIVSDEFDGLLADKETSVGRTRRGRKRSA